MMEYLVDIEESNREVPLDGLVISDVVGWEGGVSDGLPSFSRLEVADAQYDFDVIDFACRKAITGGGDSSQAAIFLIGVFLSGRRWWFYGRCLNS